MTRFVWTIATDGPPEAAPALARSRYEQIARGADQAGFDAVYLPWTATGDNPFVVAGIVAQATRQLGLLVETHAAAGSPVYIAKLLASAQRASGGRIDLSVRIRPEGDVAEFGGPLTRDAEELRAEEFVTILRAVWNERAVAEGQQRPVDIEGRFFQVTSGGLSGILSGVRLPRVYRGPDDESRPAEETTCFDGRITAHAAAGDSLIVPILVRETEEEAYAEHVGETAFGVVGSYAQAIETLRSVVADGVSEIVFVAADPLGELFRVAENVLPALDAGRREGVAA